MLIEEIVSQLPKDKKAVTNAYDNCCNLKKFISTEKEEFSTHLEKAKNDLSRIKSDYDNKAWDWVIIKSYYALHHAINALLVKFNGYYSKDHICAIIALKHFDLIPEDLYRKLRNINAKFSDFTGFDVLYSLRKISQYDVHKWKELTKDDAEAIYSLANETVTFVETRCYE